MDTEQLYEIAAKELEAGVPRKGLYAQAFSEAMGDDTKTRAIYIRLRVGQLRDSLKQKKGKEQPVSEREAHQQQLEAADPVTVSTNTVSTDTAKRTLSEASPIASPWRRFWARVLDTWLYAIALIPLAATLIIAFPHLGEWASHGANSTVLGLMLFALSPILEAVLLALFRSTPGKALLSVNLVAPYDPLPFRTWLSRSYRVWAQGLGFGLPLVIIVTMLLASHRLRKHGVTSWDEALRFSVRATPLSPLRAGSYVLILAVLGLAWVLSFATREIDDRAANRATNLTLGSVATTTPQMASASSPTSAQPDVSSPPANIIQQYSPHAPTAAPIAAEPPTSQTEPSQSWQWRNPATGRIAQLPGNWRLSNLVLEEKNFFGFTPVPFSSYTGGLNIHWQRRGQGVGLGDYVKMQKRDGFGSGLPITSERWLTEGSRPRYVAHLKPSPPDLPGGVLYMDVVLWLGSDGQTVWQATVAREPGKAVAPNLGEVLEALLGTT